MIKCKDTGEICQTYQDYLQSEHWKLLKQRYKASRLHQFCISCGTYENLDMHHKTYKRIGCEYLGDLTPLCRNCHTNTHKAIKTDSSIKLWKAHKKVKTLNKKDFKRLWFKELKKKGRKKKRRSKKFLELNRNTHQT